MSKTNTDITKTYAFTAKSGYADALPEGIEEELLVEKKVLLRWKRAGESPRLSLGLDQLGRFLDEHEPLLRTLSVLTRADYTTLTPEAVVRTLTRLGYEEKPLPK